MNIKRSGRFALLSQMLLLALIFSLASCATLSKEQIKSVEKFGTACDSFNRYPSLLFAEVAQVRLERGLFYVASLEDPENKVTELNSIYKAFDMEMKLASKCDLSLKILKSYSNALKVLTGDGRWKSRGVEFRSLGRAIDSLVIATNKLELFQEELPVGIAKSAAKIVAYGAETLLKRKQQRLTRAFVSEADTLVQALISGLVQTLRNPQVASLIENEKKGLALNYKSFLMSNVVTTTYTAAVDTTLHGVCSTSLPLIDNVIVAVPFNSMEYDRKYLQLKERCDKLTYSRGYIISASNRLAKTHKELSQSLYNKKKVGEIFEQLSYLVSDLEMLQKQFSLVITAE
ncbi:MAG: hypothetical protein WCR71_05870 [Bacteroidales bacterium]